MLPYDGDIFDDVELSLIVNKSSFEKRFGDRYNYETLYNHKKATNEWKLVIKSWKQRGIIE